MVKTIESPEEQKRLEALRQAIRQIEGSYGRGSIIRLGEIADTGIEVIPTGSLALDYALGIGGIPRGRVIEIYGPESAGKTTVALHVVAEAQKSGGVAAFVDAEHALDPQYAKRIGVNIDDLLVSQPDSGEQALEIVEVLVRSGAIDIVVIDSVAALVPRAEIDGEMGDAHIGLQARLMSQAMRKLTAAISKSKTTVIFINQLREKVGVMFGNPETQPGGRALKFYSSIRMDIRKIELLKTGSDNIGSRVKVKIVKNKLAPPFRVAEFDLMFNEGISKEGNVIDLAVEYGVMSKNGAWLYYNGKSVGHGKENAREELKKNSALFTEIYERTKSIMFSGTEQDVARD